MALHRLPKEKVSAIRDVVYQWCVDEKRSVCRTMRTFPFTACPKVWRIKNIRREVPKYKSGGSKLKILKVQIKLRF